jgi:hypothetical protein
MTRVEANVAFDSSEDASRLLQILGQLQNASDSLQAQIDLLEEEGYHVKYQSNGEELELVINHKSTIDSGEDSEGSGPPEDAGPPDNAGPPN